MPVRITPYTPSSPAVSPEVMRNVIRNLYRDFAIAEAAEEYRRLQGLNLNNFPRSVQTLAGLFAYNVIEGSRGNHAALNRALNLVPQVRRIGGGNLRNNNYKRQTLASTAIQARVRGIQGRKKANTRSKAVGTRVVMGPNNSLMVAVPNRRR
jgi:hypothetical protein